MTHTSVDPAHAVAPDSEAPEPADDNGYRILATSFIIGIAFIFAFFTIMLILLGSAAR